MADFWKDILWPGVHSTSQGTREFSQQDIEDAYASSRTMFKNEIQPPLTYEHPPNDDPEGEPQSRRDLEAARAKHTAGWARASRIKDGRLQFLFRVPDEDAVKRIENGTVKLVSPAIKKLWKKGHLTLKNAIKHVAITNKPHNWVQGPFEPVLMSEHDGDDELWLSYQEDEEMADDERTEDSSDGEGADGGAGNPDLNDRNPDQQKLEAVLVLLDEVAGVSLPADTDMDSMLDALLTGLKTAKAVNAKRDAERKTDEGDGDIALEDNLDGVAMSEQENAKLTAMRQRLADQQKASIANTIKGMAKRVPKAVLDRLTERADTIQMSDEGEEEPSMLLSEVVELLDSSMTNDITEQLSEGAEEGDHPSGDEFETGGGPTDEEMDAINDEYCDKPESGYLGQEMLAGAGVHERTGRQSS